MYYKTLIFDLDGTLLDTLQDLAAATNYTLEKNNLPVRTLDEVRMFVGNGIRKLIERAVPEGTSEAVQEQVFLDFNTYYKEHCSDTTCTYPGVVELLAKARELGCKTAIVSNKADYAVQELAKQYFPGLLDAACGEQAGIARKPAPDMLLKVMEQLGADKGTTIYIGDSDTDLLTAANTGIPCIGACWGFRGRDFLVEHGAKLLADKVEEVLPLCEYAYARMSKIKCFLFDMDGTINLGNELIPGMEGFFEKLQAAGRKYYLLTNNSSRSHEHYVQKMNGLGVPVTRKEVLISSDALTNWMQKHKPGASLFVLGTPQLLETIREAGFTLTNSLEESADYVVVGFDQTLTYERLAIACRLIDKGVPYVATHPDVRCPIEGGEFIPDTGAMLELIKTATGKQPQLIFGKPYQYMVDVVLDKTGFAKDEIAMVGDRLATDIAFGLNNDILSIMVLTGEATMEDVEQGEIKPDVILPHAKEILKYL